MLFVLALLVAHLVGHRLQGRISLQSPWFDYEEPYATEHFFFIRSLLYSAPIFLLSWGAVGALTATQVAMGALFGSLFIHARVEPLWAAASGVWRHVPYLLLLTTVALLALALRLGV